MPTLAQLDPSRTSGLRRRFEAQMAKRLRDLLRLIRQSIVDNDCFGIQPLQTPLWRAMAAARPRQFAFELDTSAKVQAFILWLKEQEADGILQVILRPGTNTAINVGWTDLYIQAAYKQGIGRAQSEMLRAQLELPFAGNLPGRSAVSSAFNLPVHADRVGVLYTRTFEDLKTVMDVVNTDARRKLIDGLTTNLSRGIAEGKSPVTIAREMVKDIGSGLDKIGLNRARMIARTEVIRAHHLANINELRRADAAMSVEVQAEFRTAGDDRVCPECSALDGKVFSLDEIESVIPVHPNSYAMGTDIYTERGFVPVEQLVVGEKCLSLHPKTFDLEYVPIVRTFAHPEKQMVHFKSRTFDMLVTKDHQMFTLRRERKWTNRRDWEFIDASKVPKESCFYRSSRWRGNVDQHITVNGLTLESGLFAEFMGWWLSDGSFNRKAVTISQSSLANPEKHARISEVCSAIDKTATGRNAIYLYNNKLRGYLAPLGRQEVRYIPNEIKLLSAEFLRVFLDAFAAGDGHVRRCKEWKGGKFEPEVIHTTSSKRMAEDLGECILKAGRCPSFHLEKTAGKVFKHRNGSYTTKVDMWFIRECRTQMARLGNVKKDIIEYDGMTHCVEIAKHHTLWIRRNGKTAWSGNCRCSARPYIARNRVIDNVRHLARVA